MEYFIGVVVVVYVVFKIILAFGRKNAKDVLVANYGLNREKLDQLKDMEITRLTASLNSLARSGNAKALSDFSEPFK